MATSSRADDFTIIRGSAEQVDAVMHIMEAAFGRRYGEAWTRSQLIGILPMHGVFLSIAVEPESGIATGFSLSRIVADEAELLLIAVDPKWHRHGIGKKLLDEFVTHSRQQKVARVHLEVRDGNAAMAMYHAAGFSPVGRRRNYYHATNGDSFDAITLARDI